jgi:hypothetical protein
MAKSWMSTGRGAATKEANTVVDVKSDYTQNACVQINLRTVLSWNAGGTLWTHCVPQVTISMKAPNIDMSRVNRCLVKENSTLQAWNVTYA